MSIYEKEIKSIGEPLPVEGFTFQGSAEAKRKSALVGVIIDNFVKSHKVDDQHYGDLFDKFYDKSITELTMLESMYKLE